MIEFAAGISVGVLFGIVIGLFLPELARRSNPDYVPPSTVHEKPAQPVPYQPPVIVLAAPRAKPAAILRVEPPGPPLLPQSAALARR